MEELSYSIHLGSDKNRTNKAKEIAKTNPSGETSFSNNGIQNAKQLSRVNKHNLRDYDNNKEDIFVIYGTNNLYRDVQELYLQEFEDSRIEYNNKQTRADRKIDNYFKHISDSNLWDLACEFIVGLGDMEFWANKDDTYRHKMIDVYNEQIKDLTRIVPDFKIANAVVHFDETSPHLHIVGVPVSNNNTRGMKKQVAKSKIFTKQSLTAIQDSMRNCCIKSYNKFYGRTAELKHKQKGRNIDVNVKDMKNYKEFKKQYTKNRKKFDKTTENMMVIDNSSKDIKTMLDSLKPAKLNKNNKVISNEDIEKIIDYTKQVSKTTQSVRDINGLNKFIDDFEDKYEKMHYKNFELENQLETKDDEIYRLNVIIDKKDENINKLQQDVNGLKGQISKLKQFWHNIMKHFQNRINYDKDENYKIVSDDLYRNGIFSDDDYEIANNLNKRVELKEDADIRKKIRNKNDAR